MKNRKTRWNPRWTASLETALHIELCTNNQPEEEAPADNEESNEESTEESNEEESTEEALEESEEKEDDAEEASEDGEGEDGDGDEDEDEDEDDDDEDEEEVVDPLDELRDECSKTAQCVPFVHHFDHCVERVQKEQEDPDYAHKEHKEDCVEEFFHLQHCINDCAAPRLFHKLK